MIDISNILDKNIGITTFIFGYSFHIRRLNLQSYFMVQIEEDITMVTMAAQTRVNVYLVGRI